MSLLSTIQSSTNSMASRAGRTLSTRISEPTKRTLTRKAPLFSSSSFIRSSPKSGFRHYSSQSTPKPPRFTKYARRTAYVAFAGGLGWEADKEFNASAIGRNLKTLWTCAIIAADYKLNFTPEKSEQIPAIHERVANRVYDLLTSNGGLYIKIGQAIASNAAVLPPAIQAKFAQLYDDAPQIPYATVRAVFESEFHRPPDGPGGVFEYFDETAMASASIAQVHKAKLKPEDGGGWVAVKVQKPAITKQVELDLGSFAVVMWMYEHWIFNVPTYFIVDFVADHLRKELDFIQEAENAMTTAKFISEEPRLRDRVYIPKVYHQYTTKKVMTAEWIDGVRMTNIQGIKRLTGDLPPLPGGPAPLKGGTAAVLQTMVELFSAQIFQWGTIHCDPHAGNIIIRPNPANPTLSQLVLLDHGLYVRATPKFQRQYASLWRALMTLDIEVIKGVAGEWGIGAPDFFASMTLMKPVQFGDLDANGQPVKPFDEMSHYEKSVIMKEKLANFLTDTDKMPKELFFIGRNMRIVQANNQMFGSPVNRIKIIGGWASRSLTFSPNLTFTQRLREYYGYFVFQTMMFTVDVLFSLTRLRQWWRGSKDDEGFEDELEKSMRGFAKDNLGMDIKEGTMYSG